MRVNRIFFLILFISCHSTNQKFESRNKADSIHLSLKSDQDEISSKHIKSGDIITGTDTITLGLKKILVSFKVVVAKHINGDLVWWENDSLEVKIVKSDFKIQPKFIETLKNLYEFHVNLSTNPLGNINQFLTIADFNLDGKMDIGTPNPDGTCGKDACSDLWIDVNKSLVYWRGMSRVTFWNINAKDRIITTGWHGATIGEYEQYDKKILKDTDVLIISKERRKLINDSLLLEEKQTLVGNKWITKFDTIANAYYSK